MTCTRIFLGIMSVAVLATPARAAQANCEEWNTEEFFLVATLETVTACLAAGADLETRNDNGYTLLHYAAFDANPAVIDALLAAGADVNVPAQLGLTPLYLAAMWNENLAVIEALLAAGADVNVPAQLGLTPLMQALEYNDNSAVFDALLAAGAELEARDYGGRTVLHLASDAAVIEVLLAAGANLEARDEDGSTPLHLAASYGYVFSDDDRRHSGPAIEALLDAGADAVARNAAGETPWDLAEANEPLQGTDGYWRLNDARFEPPGPDARRAPPSREGAEAASSGADSAEGGIGGQPPDGGTSAPGVAATGTPGFPARGGSCQIPGFPNPGDMTNLGLAWCPASETFQVRAFALQAEGMRCAVAANPSEATPEVVSRVRSQISEVCARLEALGERLGGPGDCRCPAGFGP